MSILVAGSLHLDVVVTAPHLPALDETVTGKSVDYVFGGKGGNQAVAAAQMGAAVAFAGRAGTDAFGDLLRKTLTSSHVNTDQLQLDDGPSGMSAAIVDTKGEYGAVIVSAANLNIDETRITVPEGVALVLLQNEVPEKTNISVARKAKDAGAQVWLNAAPARTLSAELVQAVDMLIVNRVEAAFYQELSASVDMLKTLGPDGVIYCGKTYPGHPVDVVSTHGAGDAFVGALAAKVAAGCTVPDAIEFAQAAAALFVSKQVSDRPALDAEAVHGFIADQDSR